MLTITILRWNAHIAAVNRGSREMDVYLNASGQVKDIRQHRLDQAATLGRYNLMGLLYFRVHILGVHNFKFNIPPGG